MRCLRLELRELKVLVGEPSAILGVLNKLVDFSLWWRKRFAREKEYRIQKLLFALRPAEVLTAQGIFLKFWEEALGNIAFPPAPISWKIRVQYRIKKWRMPFKDAEEVERLLLSMHTRGIVEFDRLTKGWRLVAHSSTPERLKPRW